MPKKILFSFSLLMLLVSAAMANSSEAPHLKARKHKTTLDNIEDAKARQYEIAYGNLADAIALNNLVNIQELIVSQKKLLTSTQEGANLILIGSTMLSDWDQTVNWYQHIINFIESEPDYGHYKPNQEGIDGAFYQAVFYNLHGAINYFLQQKVLPLGDPGRAYNALVIRLSCTLRNIKKLKPYVKNANEYHRHRGLDKTVVDVLDALN